MEVNESKKNNLLLIFSGVGILFFIIVILFIANSKGTQSLGTTCEKEAVLQLGKIIAQEGGYNSADDMSEMFFMRLSIGSIVLNNAVQKSSGSTWYNKIYNLTNNTYSGYSTYKDKSFESFVQADHGEILYIAQLVLTGKYSLPSTINLQANKSTVELFGTVWDAVMTKDAFYDTYFGHEHALNNEDIFGRPVANNSNTYFRSLANSLKLNDYSKFTVDNVCNIGLDSGTTTTSCKVNFEGVGAVTGTIQSDSLCLVKAPAAPSKSGYTFDGWGSSRVMAGGSLKVANGSTVNANWKTTSTTTTYTATFLKRDKYTTYYSTSCNISVPGSACTISKPSNPVESGYTFKGWSKSLSCDTMVTDFKIAENTKYYSCWEANSTGSNDKCWKCNDGYKWGSSGSTNPSDNCNIDNSYTTQSSCLANNNTSKCYFCSSTNAYEWNSSSRTGCSLKSNYTTQSMCLAQNYACYECNENGKTSYVYGQVDVYSNSRVCKQKGGYNLGKANCDTYSNTDDTPSEPDNGNNNNNNNNDYNDNDNNNYDDNFHGGNNNNNNNNNDYNDNDNNNYDDNFHGGNNNNNNNNNDYNDNDNNNYDDNFHGGNNNNNNNNNDYNDDNNGNVNSNVQTGDNRFIIFIIAIIVLNLSILIYRKNIVG